MTTHHPQGSGRGRPNLRRARERRGWGQNEFAVRIYNLGTELGVPESDLGVDQRRVSQWELGKAQPGTVYTALICRLLDLPPDKLDLPELPSFMLAAYRTPNTLPDASQDARVPAVYVSAAAQLEDDMRRRTFARFLAITGGIGLLRPDVLASVFDGGNGMDDALADRLSERSLQYMRQWDQLPPHVLFTVVMGHLDEIQMALNCSGRSLLTRRLRVIASETAAFAGMLGWFIQDRGLAEIALSMADDYAESPGHAPVKAIVLTIRADFHSHLQVGRYAGSAITRTMLEAAEAAAGNTPSPVRAWILLRQAEEYAVIGQETRCYQRLDLADTTFAAVESVPPGMFGHWGQDMHRAFRGNCSQLLGNYHESLDILSPILQQIDRTAVSNRVSLQTDLAAVYGRQGEPEQASALLADSLSVATKAGLRERVKRIVGVRSGPLDPYRTHSAVRRLDEQLEGLPAMNQLKLR